MHQVKFLMASQVEVISPQSTVKEAAEKMKRLDIGILPVSEGEQILGVVTDRDIVLRAIAEGQDPIQTKVSSVMTKDVIFCSEDENAQHATEVMRDKKVGRLVVVGPDQKLKGILSLGNIVRQMGEDRLAGLVSQKLSQEEPKRSFGNFGTLLGATAGVATLIAGAFYLRSRPELIERITQLGEGRPEDRAA